MVQVASGGGAAAARRGAGRIACADQVLETVAGVVAGLGVRVVAGAAGDWDERGFQLGRPARGPGARWGCPAAQAGVGGGGAVGVQRGHAPAAGGVAGGGCGQVAGVSAVQLPEPAGLAGVSE